MTGLYPESQGIVGNKVYDPNYNEKVNFLEYNGEAKLDPKWLEENNIMPLDKMTDMIKGVFIGRVKEVKRRTAKSSGKDMLVVTLYDDARDTEFFVWQKDHLVPTSVYHILSLNLIQKLHC